MLEPELAAVIGADRFLAEIKTTASLQHPQILPLVDSGEADGRLYYVTAGACNPWKAAPTGPDFSASEGSGAGTG